MAIKFLNTKLFTDANTISYWPMDGNSNDAKDGNNGSDTAMTYSTTNGLFGKGALLNGTTSQIEIGNPANLQLTGNAITLHSWVNSTEAAGSTGRWLWKLGAFGYQIGTSGVVGVPNNAWLFSLVGSGGGTDLGGGTPGVANDGLWHMIDGTYDGTTMRLYQDGVELANIAVANRLTTDSGTNLILGSIGGAVYFKGNLCEVVIASRAWTPTEIANLYAETNRSPSGGAGYSSPLMF